MIDPIKMKHHNFKHGKTGTPLYMKWSGMKSRCYDPNEVSYKHYGGRGITVSADWMDFRNFERDMGGSFKKGLSLERIDNEKGYSKDNCKWIPLNQQAGNRRNVRHFLHNGAMKTVRELSELSGIAHKMLYYRITQYGWPVELAMSLPASLGNKYKAHKALPYGRVEK